jgi:hypothetical protein
MSRAIIGGIVAVVVAALTATAYFVTTSSFESRVVKDVKHRVRKAQELLIQNASLEGLGLLKRVEGAARDVQLVEALKAEREREEIANRAFLRFLAALEEGQAKPDFLALTDAKGNLVALLDVARPPPDSWQDASGELIYPAVKLAIEKRLVISDIWDYAQLKQLMKVGVAPVIDDVDEVAGTLVIAYAVTAKEAQRQQGLLGLDVAFFHGEKVHASSFTQHGGKEDVPRRDKLGKPLIQGGLAKSALTHVVAEDIERVEIGGVDYVVYAGRLPRFSSKPLPDTYPPHAAGAAVLMSVDEAMAPFASVKLTLLLLGLGALVIAILAMLLTAKTILGPLDEIEVGINEIINGNIDRTFSPLGSDLDGLANALNVMLARLLGRPEPGEEEYDDDGNLVGGTGTVNFDTENLSPKDAEAIALAQEAEPDYYHRIYAEYIEARKKVGESVDGIKYDAFVAKLRMTEANLKQKHRYAGVRFKVVVSADRVTLKPVPIL